MFLDPRYVLRRLTEAIPPPRVRITPALPDAAGAATRCGCCPACRAFVCLPAPDESGLAPCPNCGRPTRSVDALGSGPGGGPRGGA